MGADFIMRAIPWFGDQPAQQRQAAMLAAIDALSEADVLAADEFLEVLNTHDEEWYVTDDDPDREDPTPTQIRAKMREAVGAYFTTCNLRDCGTVTLLNVDMAVTGGMSWGDDPSESYAAFEQLESLPDAVQIAGGFKSTHEDFLARVIADYPDKLPEPVRQVLDAWRVALKV